MSEEWEGAGRGAATGAAAGAAAGSIVPGWGTVIGAGVGAVVGGVSGYMSGMGKKKAKRAQNAQIEAQRRETARRQNNVTNIRAMYGESVANGTAAQKATAQRMGASLNQQVNQGANAAVGAATQQNILGAESGLAAANMNSAISGNRGTDAKREKGAVMGSYLGNQQNIATGAMQNRSGAEAALHQQRMGLEHSALGGAQDITATQAMRGQLGALQVAQTQIPGKVMGNMMNTAGNALFASSAMNARGYDTPNFFGNNNKTDKPAVTR